MMNSGTTLAPRTNINIIDEMKTSFLDYSMSVIVSRALPDVRDGLKPVHRRILFAMHEMGNVAGKPYKKSARIIGEVLGKYHPHGDSSVYEALVRLAQDFSMRHPLVDGQGNFGSIDGDSAAAMRYTEVRMERLAGELLADIEKDTVAFVANYDNSEHEPQVLPSRVPNLLINGSSGIAVGMATNIPPHNMNEIIDAVLALIDNPDMTIDDICNYVQGPDFPTGAMICGRKGILQAYRTGKGIVRIRSCAEIESVKDRERIIVSELPFQVNKARLIEKIAEMVKNKQLEGISDLRDESNKDGIRIVIDVKRDASGEIVLNHLYKYTALTTSFGINMIALVDRIPKLLNIKEVLSEFVKHRREVVTRRTRYELKKAQAKAHIMEGLKVALENLDAVIALIKAAKNTPEAREQLIATYSFTEIQASAILEMKLQRLTGLERDKIIKEYEMLLEVIADLKAILADIGRVFEIIRTELTEIRNKYGDDRRTQLVGSIEDFEDEDLIEDEPVVVTTTQKGYIKRQPVEVYEQQHRGGKGKTGMVAKDEDFVKDIFTTRTHAMMLCFTSLGKVHAVKVYRIPDATRTSRGKAIVNLIQLDPTRDEKLASILAVDEFDENSFITMLTKNGFVKKTRLSAFSNIRSNGIIGLTLEDGDEVIDAKITSQDADIMIVSRIGKALRFDSATLRETGRTSRGVISMRFGGREDGVAGMVILNKNDTRTVMIATQHGYGKRTSLEEYRVQGRGGQGVFTVKTSERNGLVAGILVLEDHHDVLMVTTGGKIIRMNAAHINCIGRVTQGVRLMRLSPGEAVKSVSRVDHENEEEKEEEETVVASEPSKTESE